MDNKQLGLQFEKELKSTLKDSGLTVLNLGYNELGDIVVLNGKARIIECKVSHKPRFYKSKNPKQSLRLKELYAKNISVYYAIKFINKHKSTIKFFIIKDDDPVALDMNEGYSLDEFLNHVKEVMKND